jgi:hypothetical protein
VKLWTGTGKSGEKTIIDCGFQAGSIKDLSERGKLLKRKSMWINIRLILRES